MEATPGVEGSVSRQKTCFIYRMNNFVTNRRKLFLILAITFHKICLKSDVFTDKVIVICKYSTSKFTVWCWQHKQKRRTLTTALPFYIDLHIGGTFTHMQAISVMLSSAIPSTDRDKSLFLLYHLQKHGPSPENCAAFLCRNETGFQVEFLAAAYYIKWRFSMVFPRP